MATPIQDILIIDDDEFSRAILRKAVEKAGYRTREAEGLETGLASLASQAAHLILLDLIMEGGSGFEFLERRKKIETARSVPIIVSSGQNDLQSVSRAIALGANDYLIKPFEETVLLQKIRKALGNPSFLVYSPPQGKHIEVTLRVPARIVFASETGFTVDSPVRIAPDTVISVGSPLLKALHLSEYRLQSAESMPANSGQASHYLTEVCALGILEETARHIRTKIRYWK